MSHGDDKGVIPLSRFAGVLGRLRGAKRADWIRAQKDPEALVAELPVQDLYFLIKEIGMADASDLVALATPEQVQGFLDLDCWATDRLKEDALRPWLEALLEAGYEKIGQVWAELDPELTALVIQRWTRIYNLTEEEVPDDEEPPFFATPDRFFMVKITAKDEDTVRLVLQLLDYLYRSDQVQARHTLRQAMSEPAPELEEQCYRWRAGRMQDLGYADYYEALEVYRPIDLASVTIGENTADRAPTGPSTASATLPAPLAEPTVRRGFLGEVLLHVTDHEEARRLEAALVTLVNHVLAADRIEPGDLEAAAPAVGRAGATLSIGLETLARGDLARGVAALKTVSLTRLHRLGHTITLQLQRLCAALGPRAARAEEPLASIAAALRSQRPLFCRLLEDPPVPGLRPFTRVDDVRRATQALARLAAQVIVVYELAGADPVALGPQVTLGDVGRTVLLHAALGHGVVARPLGTADVKDFVRAAGTPARTPEAVEALLREQAAKKQIALPPEFSPVIHGWMGELEERLGRIDPDKSLDRRILDGLLLE